MCTKRDGGVKWRDGNKSVFVAMISSVIVIYISSRIITRYIFGFAVVDLETRLRSEACTANNIIS